MTEPEIFVDLSQIELNEVNGGINWAAIGVGIGAVGLGIAIVGTGGLAAVPVGVIIGAGTAGELILAGTAIAAAGSGGAAIGYGLGK